MRTLVLFYSRTGNTQAAATALAALMGADTVEIRCPRYGPGLLSYLRAGLDSLFGRMPAIAQISQKPTDYDLVVLGCPIWLDHPALPIRAFLMGGVELPARVALLVTRNDVPPEPVFAEMQSLLAKPVVGKLALLARDIKNGSIAKQLRGFADELRAAA